MLERADRLPNRRRVMREIVDHRDSAHFAAHFLSARDSLKNLQPLANIRERHAVKAREDQWLKLIRRHGRDLGRCRWRLPLSRIYRDEGDEYVVRRFDFTDSLAQFHKNL